MAGLALEQLGVVDRKGGHARAGLGGGHLLRGERALAPGLCDLQGADCAAPGHHRDAEQGVLVPLLHGIPLRVAEPLVVQRDDGHRRSGLHGEARHRPVVDRVAPADPVLDEAPVGPGCEALHLPLVAPGPDLGARGVEHLADAPASRVEHGPRIEARAELDPQLAHQPVAAGAHLELAVPLGEVAIDARVVDRGGCLVGQPAHQRQLLGHEAALPLGLAHHEHAQGGATEPQRLGETRLLAPALHRLPALRVQLGV